MLELISIVACAAIIFLAPFETSRILAGRISKRFKGSPQQYAASYRRQISALVWLGVVFAALDVGLGFIEEEPGEDIVKWVSAALWLVVSAVCFWCRNRLTAAATAS